MPAITCPQCGAPTRVSLASPDWMTCAACRYGGAPDPRVREGLHAARQALWAVDARRRQLGWAQHRIGAGARSGGGIGCLFAILLLPFVGCGGLLFGGLRRGTAEDVSLAAIFLGPAVFMLVGGALIFRELKKTRANLETACTAVPPTVPGAPAGCHVCGADLPAVDVSRQAVVRCKYCAADNVIKPETMRGAVMKGFHAAESLLAQVNAHAMALAKDKQRSSILLAALALLAPISSCTGFFGTYAFSPEGESTADYLLVRTEAGACVATRVRNDPNREKQFTFGSGSAFWTKEPSFTPPAGRLPFFRGDELVGLKGKTKSRKGKVIYVKRSTWVGVESASFDDGRGDFDPEDLCFDEPPEGIELIDLPDSAKPTSSSSAAPKSSP